MYFITNDITIFKAPATEPQGDENTIVVDEAFSEWDSWDKPAVHQQQQQQRQTSTSSKQPVEEPEPEPDYFSDLGLAPTIRKQKKVRSYLVLLFHFILFFAMRWILMT